MAKDRCTLSGLQTESKGRGWRWLRNVACAIAAVSLAAGSAADVLANGHDDGHDEGRAYAIGLWGDLPYSDTQALVGVPNLIADMNSQKLAFTVHDGDLKAGSGTPGSVVPSTCSDALYVQAQGYFNALKSPAMFTPGDNDWTDCDRASNGAFSSRERLDHERQLFFSSPWSLGQRPILQEVQTDKLCLDSNSHLVSCVENRRWMVNGVVYATLNIQGSCNNLCDTSPDPAEYAARNHADIVWMRQTFDEAKARGASAIMFISQADPGWDNSDATRAPTRDPKTLVENDMLPSSDPAFPGPTPDGFKDFLLALRDEVIAFRKPVAYVHGDSHYFRIDRPFLDAQGRRLETFLRVETFGDNQANGNNDVHWLKVFVDDRTREVFSFQPQIVPANRTAVPQP
ncbi:hypothetical protein [Paraburkholderia diazotrophica]|uniref:Calcineurin-like phosphoesterase n=1 Tax=Paraburkholderia diazotrophica TaxID=667676 RepID=A0A1H7DVJ3_9BURK|nr:hypothetical protein [Paraburkholderia diazotrophica]SEK05414.1 hypothetical protein SAMN05192539_103512 [Paraburkholderia diazotrophica]